MDFSILNLLLVLLAAFLGGRLAIRLGYPSVLGEILAGILLGPPLLGLLYGSEALSVLSEVGVLLMMLYIGMEIDPKELGKASWGGFLAAVGGFIVPFALGYFVVLGFGGTPVAGVFVGMAMGVTSLATKSRILVDLKILDTRMAHVMMAGALITDSLSLIIFAGIMSFASLGALELVPMLGVAGKVVLFFAASWLVGLVLYPRLWRFLKRRGLTNRAFSATLVLLTALLFAEMAHLAGLHGILGAFLAGLFLREAISEHRLSHELTTMVRDVSIGFLAPVFFVTAGFEVSFGVFQTDLALLLTVIVLATVGKIVGTALFYLPTGHGWREGLVIGAGMNGRGAVEIIIAGIGLQAGIIDATIFSILVFTAIATTATVPLLLKWGVDWLRRRGELVRGGGGRDAVVIVGAGPVARVLAQELAQSGRVTLIDSNRDHCEAARALGLEAVHGDALEDEVLGRAGSSEAGTFVALTPNAEVNVLSAQRAREEFMAPQLYALLTKESDGGLFRLLDELGAHTLFVTPVDLNAWDGRLAAREVARLRRTIGDEEAGSVTALHHAPDELPLVVARGDKRLLFRALERLEPGDQILTLAATP